MESKTVRQQEAARKRPRKSQRRKRDVPGKQRETEQLRSGVSAGNDGTDHPLDDPYLEFLGTIGVVEFVDDVGQIHVRWSRHGSLPLIYGEDEWERLG